MRVDAYMPELPADKIEVKITAFITAAVNERDIEQLFGLDPMQEGVLAVSGFGWRGAEQVDEAEFDPLGSVWRNSV